MASAETPTPQPALWVKVVSCAPSTATIDRDYRYGRLECADFPADVHALKVAVIAARGVSLAGVLPSNLRVYYRGASEADEAAETAFVASPRDHLPAYAELRSVIGESPEAFLLVTAFLRAAQLGFETISVNLFRLLPPPLPAWLHAHPLRLGTASLSLFFAWGTASSRLPASVKEWGFPLALVLSLIALAATHHGGFTRGGVLLLLLVSTLLLAAPIFWWARW